MAIMKVHVGGTYVLADHMVVAAGARFRASEGHPIDEHLLGGGFCDHVRRSRNRHLIFDDSRCWSSNLGALGSRRGGGWSIIGH